MRKKNNSNKQEIKEILVYLGFFAILIAEMYVWLWVGTM